MRLLDRYLLRELLTPLFFCLVGFLLFWDAFSLFTDLSKFQERGLSLADVVELYVVRIPGNLVLILPMVLLLALLYALTNHARHHELTAIRAAGVSLWRICLPYFGVGFLLSLALFGMNEYWVPDASDHEERILNRHQARQPGAPDRDEAKIPGFSNSRDGRNWLFNLYNTRTHVITAPKIVWTGASGGTLVADRAEYLDGAWTFLSNVRVWTNRAGEVLVPVLQTNRLAVPDLTETPEQIAREVKFASRFNDQFTHSAQSGRSIEVPIAEILDYLDLHPHDLQPNLKSWLKTQLHGHLAAPWTCLVVVLIAIPFGAASGRRNLFVGVASSIVICFAYIVLFKLGLAMGTGGYLPAWLAAWAPNLLFGIAGIWLMLRVR